MKRPFFTKGERLEIRNNSYHGAKLNCALAWEKFKRSVRSEHNCLLAECIILYVGNIKLETKYKEL